MLEDGIEPPTKLVFGGRLAPYLMFFAMVKLVGATKLLHRLLVPLPESGARLIATLEVPTALLVALRPGLDRGWESKIWTWRRARC